MVPRDRYVVPVALGEMSGTGHASGADLGAAELKCESRSCRDHEQTPPVVVATAHGHDPAGDPIVPEAVHFLEVVDT